MPRYSKNGRGDSAQDHVGKTICESCVKLLDNRRRLLNPLGVDDPYNEIFCRAFSEAEWHAWEVLRKNSAFSKCVIFDTRVTIKSRNAIYRIPLGGIASTIVEKVPNVDVEMDNLPINMQNKLYLWGVRELSYQKETELVLDKIVTLCQMCTTPGQLKRVWPELLSLMPSHTKEQVFKAKARSPYPAGVVMHAHELIDGTAELIDGWVIHPDWTAEALEWFNGVIAEAVILPYSKSSPLEPSISQY